MKKIRMALLTAVVILGLTTVAYADAALEITPSTLLLYMKHYPVEFLIILTLLLIFGILWWIGRKKD